MNQDELTFTVGLVNGAAMGAAFGLGPALIIVALAFCAGRLWAWRNRP